MRAILRALGFSFDRQDGSHEQWVCENPHRVVSVDEHYKQFDDKLMKLMIRQSGIDRVTFYRATKTTGRKIQK